MTGATGLFSTQFFMILGQIHFGGNLKNFEIFSGKNLKINVLIKNFRDVGFLFRKKNGKNYLYKIFQHAPRPIQTAAFTVINFSRLITLSRNLFRGKVNYDGNCN